LSVARGSARGRFGLLLLLFAMLVAGCAVTADERAGGTPQTPATRVKLLDTYWRLAEIDGTPFVIHAGARDPHILLGREGGRVTGFTGCNSLTGSYKQSADSLRFGPLAMTHMACVAADAMAREAAFTKALQDTASQHIVGNSLELRDAAGTVRIRFEARQP
jgi:heat shock protein HslJ